jgi:hypothetical protein
MTTKGSIFYTACISAKENDSPLPICHPSVINPDKKWLTFYWLLSILHKKARF